jgi:hypothetical protein
MSHEPRLEALAAQAWDIHRHAEADGLEHLVRPSVPILFFGDSRSYVASRVRVLTVGLNPSREEFPRADPFSRFGCAGRVDGSQDPDLTTYLRSLNEYFRLNPYRKWFDPSFEPLLSGLGASYYAGCDSTALHTDLCTPLATDPTWSHLKPDERNLLRESGRRLWHDLVHALAPDLVLVSIQRALADTISFPLAEDLGVVFELDGPKRAGPYRLEATRRYVDNGKVAVFVFGQAAQTPFGSVSANDKRVMGARLRELVDA